MMRTRNHTAGFTLIEILVSFALSAVVFVVVSTILATLFLSNTKGKKQEKFEQVKNDLFVELTNSIRWGKNVIIDESGKTITVINDTATDTYSYNGTSLLKNGKTLGSKDVDVYSFTVTEFFTVPVDPSILPPDPQAGHSPNPGVKMQIGLRDKSDGVTTDALDLFVAHRRTETKQ